MIGMTLEELQALPLPEQKVKIAEDVMALLDAKKIQAKNGKYISTPNIDFDEVYGYEDDEDGTEIIDELVIERLYREWDHTEAGGISSCGVCQIGGLFVGALDTFNSLKLEDIHHGEPEDFEMTSYLERWWTEDELRIMEAAFEGQWHADDEDKHVKDQDGDTDWNCVRAEVQAAFDFAETHFGGEDAMRKILNNIIRNKGDFRPDQDVAEAEAS
jgi:hypothetical protein